ncbi:TonB-dependent receptor plug domain-containing protein [Falsigemmobacter faecalis]|uniref:TonB-dependent receptor n=1 Tax=Falsigemmobacter faecalis TaxID=2488730 RepID=A0A3P3D4S0_9RHOB|nr:TonB-dependent receptor [Falsigemmobacter faecalis]RRH69403.1 TonB-dependent receptor [Falsigemmobacter faecalis]
MSVAPTTASRLARARLLTGCALISAALPFAALAQDVAAEDDVQLDAILVSSASGKATSVQDAPASITVIDAAELAATGARDLREALRTVPGLNITNGNDGGKTLSFRGMPASRTLQLVDGRRIGGRNTMARDYQGDLGVVPIDAIERIEVVRGPMSTLYGSDAMGGVINIITKKGYDVWSGSVTAEATRGDASTTSDSNSLSGFVTGPVAQDLTFSAWGKLSETGSPVAVPTTGTGTRVSNKGDKTRVLGARLNWKQSDVSDWGLELGNAVEDYLATDAAGGAGTREVSRNHLVLSHGLTLGTGRLDSALRFETSKSTSLAAGAAAPNSFDTLNFETRYSDLSTLAGREFEYTLGLTATKEKLFDAQSSSTGTVVDDAALSGALFAEGRLRFNDALTLTAGLRVDQHERFGTHVTPRLYANYDFGGGLTLKAGYSQGFVAPDLRNLSPNYQMSSNGNGCKPYQGPCIIFGNPDLKPETSDNFELGLNYQGADLSWEVTGFYNDITDMIGARRTNDVFDQVWVTDRATGTPVLRDRYKFVRDNFDKGRTAGIEAGFNWTVNDSLTWNGTATYMAISEFQYGNANVTFPMSTTPKWNLGTGVTWQANDRLKLNGQVNYVGKQANLFDATGVVLPGGFTGSAPAGQNTKAYTLVNIGASYDLTPKATLNIGIENLFDRQPEKEVSYAENGRLFRVGITTRF